MKELKLTNGGVIKVHFDGDLASEDTGEVSIRQTGFCEHCGDLPPYSLEFNDDGTTWCVDCADCIYTPKEIPELLEDVAAMAQIKAWQAEELRNYHASALNSLDEGEEQEYDIHERLATLEETVNDLENLVDRLMGVVNRIKGECIE